MTQTAWLYVLDTLADWEYGYAVAGISNPQFQRHPGRFQVRTVSRDGAGVTTAGHLRVAADAALADVDTDNSAILILPGGSGWDQGGHSEAVDLARRFLSAGTPVAAICGATAGLARGGILDSRPHTSNAREYLAATGYKGGAYYRDEPAIADGDLITASSMAPLAFARAILERLDVYPADALAAWFELFSTGDPAAYERLMNSQTATRAA
jgi:putative intracellular protease/amidase